jgi:hypothetical protein
MGFIREEREGRMGNYVRFEEYLLLGYDAV